MNINYIFFRKVDTIFIVVNLTIFNFIIYNNRKYNMTASLGNFIASLFAGAFVALTIGGVLVYISQSDRITRDF